MMRVAVAGGGGLGFLLATALNQTDNAYNVIVLSRTQRPEYHSYGIQVHVVDYHNIDELIYALHGTDLVFSTVSGEEQLNLINAAGHARVRTFVPSEFEGKLSRRPTNDPLDRGTSQVIALLQQWGRASRMRYTVFSCGLLMERFHPYGLHSLDMGFASGNDGTGDFIVDINNATAEYAERDRQGNTVYISLTSVYDLVHFIVSAVDLGPRNWPNELVMRGDRLSVKNIVRACSMVRSMPFTEHVQNYAELLSYLDYSTQSGDITREAYYHRLIGVTNGRYDFAHSTLNQMVNANPGTRVQPVTFNQWLTTVWPPVET